MRRGYDRQNFRLDFRFGNEHERRRHVGRRRGRGGEDLCRIGKLGLWQTDPLGRDYCRAAFLQRCVCNEHQRCEHRTDCCKIGENWHRLTLTARRHTPRLSPSNRRLVELDHGITDLYVRMLTRLAIVLVCGRELMSNHIGERRSDANSTVNRKNQLHMGHDALAHSGLVTRRFFLGTYYRGQHRIGRPARSPQ